MKIGLNLLRNFQLRRTYFLLLIGGGFIYSTEACTGSDDPGYSDVQPSSGQHQPPPTLPAEKNQQLTEPEAVASQPQGDDDSRPTALSKTREDSADTTPTVFSKDSLNDLNVRRDYAAGVSLGMQILHLQSEYASLGIEADKATILSGINDAFEHKPLLSPEEVKKIMAETQATITAARDEIVSAQQQQGREFQAKFLSQPGAQSAAMGYWYQIDYSGNGKIPPDAVFEIAIKETRIDGKVIQDMDASGVVLQQKMSEFPPVFRDALAKLENHGSITLLVPPELAYGDSGYPPDIPPSAYIIYHIRVADVYPDIPIVEKSVN